MFNFLKFKLIFNKNSLQFNFIGLSEVLLLSEIFPKYTNKFKQN